MNLKYININANLCNILNMIISPIYIYIYSQHFEIIYYFCSLEHI